MQPWAGLMQGLLPGAQTPAAGSDQLRLGIERTFGGLGDAFGLGPMRELEQAWREMLVASAAKRRAQVEYLALVAQAWNKGTLGLIQELQAMGARGERVESLLAFIRLWAKSVDAPLHETMQEARGLEVTAKVIRASSQHREQLQKTIGLASEALHMPTRKDMDDAFREIQELKRELRRLKKVLPAAAQSKLIHSKESDA
jgi:class III poly(R)-hydroxyalkanoic acid synthase PhaE subunit